MADLITSIDATTYKIEDLGRVKPVIVLGGTTEKFVPNVNLSYKCGTDKEQYWINLNRPAAIVADEKELLSDDLSLRIGDVADVWKVVDDRLKWDIVYYKDPRKDTKADIVETFTLKCHPDLAFHYQGDLSQDEIDHHCYRPDEVIGSYAIYGNKKHNGYTTGKVGHIYRPLCIDAVGEQFWATLYIDKASELLRITISAKDLAGVTWPLKLDPTLGQTDSGATNWNFDGYSQGIKVTAPANGTITAFYVDCASSSVSERHIKVAVYSDSSGPNTLQGSQAIINVPALAAQAFQSVAYSTSIVSGTAYWLCLSNENTTVDPYYDAVADASERKTEAYASAITGGSWSSDGKDYEFSMYVDYTESGGGVTMPLFLYHYMHH